MRLTKPLTRVAILLPMWAGCCGLLRAQSLVGEALTSFPADTIRIEYSHPAVLRTLPDYATLRQRYEGPRLRDLEGSLSKLGIQEGDVEELVLGWRATSQQWTFFGLTSGRFSAKAVADQAAAQGVAGVPMGGYTAYCVGAGEQADCLALLGESLGAFGSRVALGAMLAARDGSAPSLGSNTSFTKWVRGSESKTPIWGLATGVAVADWFRSWMPNQTELKLDWSQAFKDVQVLTYSIDPGETVKLSVGMECDSSENAASLRQVFDGVRLFQQISWQNQNPGRPNPYQNLQISAEDRHVSIVLDTPYAELLSTGTPGST